MMVFLKKAHKWVSLLIGIQLLLWLLSGLFLSLIDSEKVSGAKWATVVSPATGVILDRKLLEPHELSASQLQGALNLSLQVRRGQTVYRIRRTNGTLLVNASNGETLMTNKSDAKMLAQQDFGGSGEILSIKKGVAPDLETSDSNGDYWRVNFSDDANTSIYISVATGEILERRNRYWRQFDFFWMLHIMDYSGHKDINNALVISIALISVWLGLSGFMLLFCSFGRHDFHFLNVFGKQPMVTIKLVDPQVNVPQLVRLRKNSNLFMSLTSHGINLPSSCGGGGDCGRCRVQFDSFEAPEVTKIELSTIPEILCEQGWRLACQHKVENSLTLHLRKGTLVSVQGSLNSSTHGG